MVAGEIQSQGADERGGAEGRGYRALNINSIHTHE